MDSSSVDARIAEVNYLNERIIACSRCPRLRSYCQEIGRIKRKAYQADTYWTKPVPNFGDPLATRLIVGLAPAAHGANRTGRMFTGDRSGDFLFAALHRQGVANQPTAIARGDGLELTGVLITACVHCAPPDNKPSTEEIGNCADYLQELLLGRQWKSILCLGQLAWNQTFGHLKKAGFVTSIPKFGHGVRSDEFLTTPIYATFHPSQQNTFTGKLTEAMLAAVLEQFLKD